MVRYIFFLVWLLSSSVAYSAVNEVMNLDVPENSAAVSDQINSQEASPHSVSRMVRGGASGGGHEKTGGYRLGSGDKIQIYVFGEDSLSMEIRLDETGIINYPFLGSIAVKGKTVEALRHEITDGLKQGYMISPHVNVSIVEHRPFFIKGEVGASGSYPYVPGLTVRKAIALAGGFSEFADREKVMVTYGKSRGNKVASIGMGGEVSPDDTITVLQSVYFIDGEVQNTGSYPYRLDMTLREAISLAGGLTERASDKDIYIISKNGNKKKVGDQGMRSKIHSGDSIFVKQSFF